MRKKSIIFFTMVIAALLVCVPIMAIKRAGGNKGGNAIGLVNINLWQIDGFEGGKGSRSGYLKSVAESCFKDENIYFTVTSLTAAAARENIESGNLPDIISYPGGFYGIEDKINAEEFTYKTWVSGTYCVITLDEGSDFSDVTEKNTILNVGTGNLAVVAAKMYGLNNLAESAPVNAYLQLLGGKYKYLFGTQRDIYRLITRKANYSFAPVAQFNDLYQNISILTKDSKKYRICCRFVEYVLNQCDKEEKLGLFGGEIDGCDDALKRLYGVEHEYKLNYPCSKRFIEEVKTSAQNSDVNKIKNLLK